MSKDFVFVTPGYECDKNCPYCVAKMNKSKLGDFDEEILKLRLKLMEFKKKRQEV